ncbi:putative polyol transporter 6 [Apostasia shenzhenica]|uniref:Putative polyol transporter 6 n=1 Tax=Apostasia shenzhenica TaxID=1088818 RepID=A0A2I0ADI8_9ASPA|nr:putative polyol transporter 6 [Apostasia shenzhenica]
MSGAMLFIKEDLKISEVQVEFLAGVLNFCALAGSLTAGRISDSIGRRYTIVVASVIFLIGSLLMGFAPDFPVLISGRCVAGVGVGYALMIAPVYSAEISPTSYRGLLTSLPEICISSGILLGYIANIAFAKLPLIYGWRAMLGICAIPSLFLIAGVLFMPESPRWLVLQGRLADARSVLLKLSNSSAEAELRLQRIKAAAGIPENCDSDVVPPAMDSSKGKGVWKEMFLRPTPTVKRILVVAVGMHFLQHVTGIEAIVLYSPRIFKAAGVNHRDKLLFATMGVGVTKVAFIMVATFLLDRVGRRPLLLTSVTGMFFSLICVGFGLLAVGQSPERLPWAVALCVTGVLGFIAFFSMGMGPITWVYSSEIYPLRLRAQAASVGVAVNRLTNATMASSFISLYQALTIAGAFFLFAGMSLVAWLFFYFLCPETKGRPLEEVEMVFSHGWIARKGRKTESQLHSVHT